MFQKRWNWKNGWKLSILLVCLIALTLGFTGCKATYMDPSLWELLNPQTTEAPTEKQTTVQNVEIQTQEKTSEVPVETSASETTAVQKEYRFRNKDRLNDHYKKHGIEMGFASAKEYEKAASAVVNNPNALHKTEKEDGDDVYYVEETNEFVIVSKDGYLRTYFNPSAGIDYYNRQ